MNIENFLEQLEGVDLERKKELLLKYIGNEYINKSKVVDLQKEINQLVKENNQIQKQISSKFSRQEHQTIAFQLGKGLIDIFNKKRKVKTLPKLGVELFVESIKRKNIDDLTNFQKTLSPFIEYIELYGRQKDYKKTIVQTLKKIINEIEKEETSTKKIVDGKYQEVKFPELETAKIKETKSVKVVNNLSSKQIKQSTVGGDRKLKIACIMDEFTYFCFSPEAELLQLSPEHWLDEIVEFKPDLLFIESAWQGKESLWKSKVSQNSDETVNLIKYCRINSIKTLFWNKEDPIHFGTFIDVAKQVDVVFTTDIDCIGRYKSLVGHENVYLLPFAAQPKTHNPIEKYERKDAFNFAGSFYLKYPERQRDFVTLTKVATKFRALEIYDRNFNKPHPHYTFPEKYQQYILGCLEPHEIDKAYKGYVYGINMNTIKQSQSMFARRVFEMLASNTIVLSNYSRGVRNFFGDLVLCSDNPNELENKLSQIVHDKNLVDKFKLLGLKKVLSEHTYEDRIEYIINKLKVEWRKNRYKVAVVAKVENKQDFEQIYKMFSEQDYQDKQLFIFNPMQVLFDTELEVVNCGTIQLLEEGLKNNLIDYVSFFSVNNFYLPSYITDLALSFKFLKFEKVPVVTKDHYYTYNNGDIVSNEGKEYQHVDEFILNRSAVTVQYILDNLTLLSRFFNNSALIYKDQAFAIDRFDFIENTNNLNKKDFEIISSNLENIDSGVKLKEKLLPYAESIVPSTPEFDQKIIFDINYFEKNVVSNNKFIQVKKISDEFIIQSRLAAKQHKYLLLASKLTKQSGKIALQLNAESNFYAQMVVEFYDSKDVKVGFKICEISGLNEIELPCDADYFNISVRLKGTGKIIVHSLNYVIQGQEKSVNDQKQNESLKVLNAEVFKKGLVKGSSNQIQFVNNHPEKLLIRTTLAPTKHCYLYLKEIFPREEINLVLNSEFELKATTTAEDARIVFEFQDENKQKISHSMSSILGGHALAIPMHCKYVRIGFKIVGKGETEIQSLSFGIIPNPIHNFIPKSDVLVVAKQYPSYDDLYKYGFLHTRLKAYKREGQPVDMFRVTTSTQDFGFSEFEGIDLFSHDHVMLDKLLASGAYKKVCIHLIDKKIWDIVKKYQDKVQVLIWVHGAEIQVWQRREFEFERFSDQEITRQKKLSDQRKNFWRTLVLNELSANTQFIFVSQYFLNESEQDLNITFPKAQCHIVHNYIDTNFFNYVEKPVTQRFKLLSIRPFASRKYANDLTVKAIEELAKRPNFDKFEIAIYGDGPLFEETTESLKKFKNVHLHKKFLNHFDIAQLHKEYGVFIVPTRMDSQGVSRDEAMSSGLVPVTTAVTAIPEFVDQECGMLVAGEDYLAMAKEIYDLSRSAKRFKSISLKASQRVKEQSGYDQTILKEIKMLFDV